MKKQRDKNDKFDQKSFAVTIRQNTQFQARIITMISLVSGLIYITAGCGLFIFTQSHTLPDAAKEITLLMIVSGFFVLIFTIFPLLFFLSPKCPFCRRNFRDPRIPLATGFCPECRRVLFKNEKLSGIKLPTIIDALSHFYIYEFLSFFFVMTIFALLIKSYAYIYYWQLISAFAFCEGLALLFFPFYLMIRHRIACRRPPETPACEICGGIPLKGLLSVTGNCSNCGSPVNDEWAPPEPEPLADLPTWNEIKKYQKKIAMAMFISTVLAFAASAILFYHGAHTDMNGVWFFLIAIIILFPGMISPILYMEHRAIKKRSKFMVYFRCPYCDFSLRPNGSTLKNVERCPKCRRRLIKRTGADEN